MCYQDMDIKSKVRLARVTDKKGRRKIINTMKKKEANMGYLKYEEKII